MPLDGLRVLEFGHYLAGPFAATILADFGAEVIKVEPLGSPDLSRGAFGPTDKRDPERSPFFAVLARNKKSVSIDLRSDDGLEVLLKLVARSDVIIENFRPGKMEAIGLGPDDVKKVNPDLTYVRISGFGQVGPASQRAGVDDIAAAMGGLTFLTGYPDGPPVRPGMTVGDHGAAMVAALGVTLALLAHRRSGIGGQLIDVSLYDPILMMLDDIPASFSRDGTERQRVGNGHEYAAPSGIYRCLDDKWVALSASSEALFARLSDALEWGDDFIAPLATMSARIENRARLDQAISDWCALRTAEDAVSVLAEAGLPVGVVNDIPGLLSDPHMKARGDFETLHDDRLGEFVVAAPKPRLSKTPGQIRSQAPGIGEHTEAVLRDVVECSPEELDRLRSLGVIVQ